MDGELENSDIALLGSSVTRLGYVDVDTATNTIFYI